MTASLPELYNVIDGTWPASRFTIMDPWLLRRGDGGGKRVSAATATGPVTDAQITLAEKAMLDVGQDRLFMLRAGDETLDAQLHARGYSVVDPVNVYAAPVDMLTDIPIPRVTVFNLWEPLAIMIDIWKDGGVDEARLRVMDRARGPKTALFSRLDDKPAGVAFVAIHDNVAMVHAVEVVASQRRKGAAAWMMRAASFWAKEHGAHTLSVICTQANIAGNALYASLGFAVVGQYHYRLKPKDTK